MQFKIKISRILKAPAKGLSRWLAEPDLEKVPPTSRLDKVLRIVGIHIPADRKDRLHIRPRFFKLLALASIVLILALGGLVTYSGSPSFCNSCHIMSPYYQAWATSKHNFVACVDCHYPPGTTNELWRKYQNVSQIVKYVTRTYGSKPYAEIEDAACLRQGCHATRLLQGKVTFKRDIIFDHRPHLEEKRRGRQLRCTSCHSQIVVGSHMEVTEDTCFLCHFKGLGPREELPLGRCPLCHQAPKREIKVANITFNHKDFVGATGQACQKCHLEVIQGDGRVPKERCFSCHNEPHKLELYKDMPLIHDRHVARSNIECGRCHEPIQHALRPAVVPIQADCPACHQGMHRGNSLLYAGTGGKGVPSTPSPMFLAQVDCVACHIIPAEHKGQPLATEFAERTFEASEAACISCHDSRYKGMKQRWTQAITSSLKEFEPKLRQAETKMREAPGQDTRYREALRLLDDARYNYQFLREAAPVHNVYYAARLLQAADENLDRVTQMMGYSFTKMDKNILVSGRFCQTLCHEQVGVKLPAVARFNSTTFPHERHFTEFQVGCANCHQLGQHKEVKLKVEKGDCQTCHHGVEPARCTRCHSAQANFYSGRVQIAGVKSQANVMVKTVDCSGCHDLSKKHSVEAVTTKCLACHGEGYKAVMETWRTSLADVLKQAQDNLTKAEAVLAAVKEPALRNQARAIISRARADLNTITKAKGLHNPDMAEAVLASVSQRAQQAAKMAQAK